MAAVLPAKARLQKKTAKIAQLQRQLQVQRQQAAQLGAVPGFNQNRIGQKAPQYKFGWLGRAITQMGNTKRWAVAKHPDNQILVGSGAAASNQPLLTIYNSPDAYLNAARVAVQGDATKIVQQALWAAANLQLTLTGAKVFAVRVRITNSELNFKFATYNIRVLDGANLRAQVLVHSGVIPVDLIISAISPGVGQASIVPITNPIVEFLLADNPGLVTGDAIMAESLNMRDIGDITGEGAPCQN